MFYSPQTFWNRVLLILNAQPELLIHKVPWSYLYTGEWQVSIPPLFFERIAPSRWWKNLSSITAGLRCHDCAGVESSDSDGATYVWPERIWTAALSPCRTVSSFSCPSDMRKNRAYHASLSIWWLTMLSKLWWLDTFSSNLGQIGKRPPHSWWTCSGSLAKSNQLSTVYEGLGSFTLANKIRWEQL